MLIESLEKWNELAEMLLKHGYGLRETQYDIYDLEGFKAMFGSINSGYSIVEIVTHNETVYDAIIRYGV